MPTPFLKIKLHNCFFPAACRGDGAEGCAEAADIFMACPLCAWKSALAPPAWRNEGAFPLFSDYAPYELPGALFHGRSRGVRKTVGGGFGGSPRLISKSFGKIKGGVVEMG
jgi:hypothetical protein